MTNIKAAILLRRALTAALATACIAGAAGKAHAINFPIAAASMSTTNPAGPWSYMEGSTTSPNLLTTQYQLGVVINGTPTTIPGWIDPTPPNNVPLFGDRYIMPGVWKSPTGFNLPNNTMFMHPAHGGVQAILRFIVPAKPNGTSYKAGKITYKLTDLDPFGGDGISWEIDHNGVLASGSLFSTGSGPLATTGNHTLGLFPVHTGDTIYFVVDAGPNGDENYDTTGLKGMIHLQ
jgi:hypothetical protein